MNLNIFILVVKYVQKATKMNRPGVLCDISGDLPESMFDKKK
jgi:hypothetical protein